MKKRLLVTVIIVNLYFIPVHAQKYSFTNYNTTTGLTSNEVRGLFQDQNGALYITTTAGISIFDGYRFKNYGYKDGIRFDYVKNFAESGNGFVYLFGNTGKEAYLFKDNIYKGFFQTPNIVTQYFQDKNKNGYVCTDIGIFKLTDTVFSKMKITDDTSRAVSGFYKYIDANDSIALVMRTFPTNRFDIINKKQRKIIYTIPGFFGFQFLKDTRNRIWVCTDYLGIKMIDAESLKNPDSIHLFQNTPGVLASLAGTQINNAVEDKLGNIWFATTGKGLAKLAPDGTCQFIKKENGLLSNTIFRVFADRNDNIWIGSEYGLQRMLKRQLLQYDVTTGLPDDATYDAIEIDTGRLLLSSQHDISFIDEKIDSIQTFPLPHPEEGYIIRFIKNQNQVWALTPKRLLKINSGSPHPVEELTDALDETFKDFSQLADGSFIAISNTKIIHIVHNKYIILADSLPTGRAIVEDNNSLIWAGTNKGLYVYRTKTEQGSIQLLPILKGYIFKEVFQIRYLTKDIKGLVWAATREKGLFQLAIKKDSLQILNNLTRENGLSNDNVRHLLFINDSILICGTISGIDRISISPGNKDKVQISKLTDLPDNSFAVRKSNDGKILLVPFLGGLILYAEESTQGNGQLLNNRFTECYINGKELESFSGKGTIKLSHNQNDLLFYFSPHIYSNARCHFLYWLDNGENENWVELGFRNFVQFNNLSAGSYTLYIKAIEGDDENISSIISKKIIIKPFWYRTLISKVIGLAVVAVIAFLLIRKRFNSLQKEAMIRQQIAETEMAALKAQMNPHFMFNCINSIDAFIQSNDKYNATLYLNKFAKLIRNILDSSKHNLISFSRDMDTLKLYIELEQLRSDHRFTVDIEIEEELMNSDYKVPPLIIQPFVENAIIHGLRNKETSGGKLSLHIFRDGERIHYHITDNGIGRVAAGKLNTNKQESYGIRMSYDRIRLFNQEASPAITITDLYEQNVPAGTSVDITLKIV